MLVSKESKQHVCMNYVEANVLWKGILFLPDILPKRKILNLLKMPRRHTILLNTETFNKASFYVIILFPVIACLACHASHVKLPQAKVYKKVYTDEFKLTYFRKLLAAGFNQSPAIRDVISSDRSGFTEPVLSQGDIQVIDSLITADSLYMNADSVSRIGYVAEGSAGKHIFGFIINKLTNRFIDSVANKRYKISGFGKKWNK